MRIDLAWVLEIEAGEIITDRVSRL